MAEAKALADAERAKQHGVAAKRAAKIWRDAKPATDDHSYIIAKGVKPYGLRLHGDCLVIPLRDSQGKLWSLQFIGPDGTKRFLSDGRKRGCYFAIGKPTGVLCFCEGFATGASIHEATGYAVAVAFDAGNLIHVATALRSKLPDLQIILSADNDINGDEMNVGIEKATEAARAVGGFMAVPELDGHKCDFNDLHQAKGLDAVKVCIEAAVKSEPLPIPERQPAKDSRINVIDAFDFMALQFPPRENVLAPWLPRQGLAMVYAPRGIGKTHFSLNVAYAVASAGSFLHWRAPASLGVLFLDGEMPASVLQERLARIAASSENDPVAPLKIITPDLQPAGMIDLSKPTDQEALNPYLDGISLIIADNLSTLCRRGRENESEGWLPVQEWALLQRAAGRSVLFIHHAGKDGNQRGTSRREDVLDSVIALRRPAHYTPDQGACFEVHFEKSRGIYGDDIKPFEAQLIPMPDGLQKWTMKTVEQSTAEKVAAYLNEGVPQQEIAELL
ncbi:MAG: AAA family ATPase, partial [Desulfobulbaceae bacterium]|nr:AAA family ATPase [Desulfobulbaceae bacterium]